MAFGAPDNSQFKPEAHNGRLALVLPHEYKSGIPTTYGVKDAIDAEVVILDGPEAGLRIPTARIFSLVMLGQLKGKVGGSEAVLGRIGKGQAKQGQQAPWILADPTDEDIAVATRWEQKYGELKQPASVGASSNGGGNASSGENWASQRGNTAPPKPDQQSYDEPPF